MCCGSLGIAEGTPFAPDDADRDALPEAGSRQRRSTPQRRTPLPAALPAIRRSSCTGQPPPTTAKPRALIRDVRSEVLIRSYGLTSALFETRGTSVGAWWG